ncbi:Rv0361 family membrane protein [Gordonia crocea]|uniref:DUF4878 domain-containing protein n=1 Tax=Gordonia crocea TaxID=589162 RepID=A0A7I9V1T1_9ACTN|nr:hypothetical protein [Gordonia crocea]GED99142.1 hypothetical protein nbrc107697_31810 [Gordonia crocea]
MAESRDDDLGRLADELNKRDAPTKGPFLAALAVVVVLIGVILIVQWVRPFSDRISDEDTVRIAVNDHYTARNAVNYDSFRAATCAAKVPPRAEFESTNTRSREANGRIVIPQGQIADVTITGDKASATVTWHYEKRATENQKTPTTLIRQDDKWKVC